MRLSNAVASISLLALLGASRANTEDQVQSAALTTYLHGMTDQIAREQVGVSGVPRLLELLRDPRFSRRDNAVAMLAYLGGPETTPNLLGLLDAPPHGVDTPEEDRALLTVPEALGRIAASGDTLALAALLDLTEIDSSGGRLDIAVARGAYGSAMRRDLEERAVRALAFTGHELARARLVELATARLAGPDRFSAAASEALQLFDAMFEEMRQASSPVSHRQLAGGGPGAADLAGEARTPNAITTAVQDTATRTDDHQLTYANHPDAQLVMSDSRLDTVLAESSRRAGTGDFDDDTACCITLSRGGSAATFGSSGDGLDVIDSSTELDTVLQNSVARVKVIRFIQYCGGPGTNIIGCAYTPGFGMALVRLSSLGHEAVLWIHEYGHNTGLPHRGDSTYIMYASDNGNNRLLKADECRRFHQPAAQAQITTFNGGTCTADGDEFADVFDNCPGVANSSQAESDGDGFGDACDNCPVVSNADQTDTNGNGVGDVCDTCLAGSGGDPDGDRICGTADNCPSNSNALQVDFDDDGWGDACESGARTADIDHSSRVDGIDLARLGRAFASNAVGGPAYDAGTDLDRNSVVDGADLALLATQFGRAVN